MKPSEKLKKLREKAGRTPHEIAEAIGISDAEYYDLESYDDLENCITLGKLKELVALLSTNTAFLFSEDTSGTRRSPAELASLLKKMVDDRGITLAQAEEEIGWELSLFLQNPDLAILDWNVTCLRDVCAALGCNWLAVLK